MNKVWLIAKREYLYNLRRRSFLFGAFGVPLFVIAIMFVSFGLSADAEDNVEGIGQVGYVDQEGVLAEATDRPEFFVPYLTEAEARQALDDKTLGAYFVVPESYLETGSIQLYTYTSIPEALHDEITNFLLKNLSARLVTPLPAERLIDPVDMTIQIQDSGRTLTNAQIGSLFLTPIIFVILFAMSSQITSGFLMSGVIEEKTNRIMEILITSITPMQLLVGKIVGLGILGLTQIGVWAAGGALIFALGKNSTFLAGVSIPTDLLLIGLLYFLLMYFLLASIMAGIGAVSGSEQESRQLTGLFSLILFIPFFAIVTFITDPNGTLPTILTLFPLTAPVSVILRLSFSAVPAWQLVASVLILLLTTLVIMWASARIFRWALLLYGKRLSPRELLRVIRQSPRLETAVSPARAEEAS